AGKIKGITIEIAGDTQPLNKALKDVNKSSQDIQKELRQVERLLKFNPGNTELLAQKQKLLGEQVAVTREKLDRLKQAQAEVEEQFKKGQIGEEQYRAFQRELVKTESQLKHFEQQLKSTGMTAEQLGKKLQDAGKKMTDAGKNLSMKVTAPVVGLGAAIVKTGMDFEAGMSEVGAISGATGKDLQALESLAKEMGATTKFSASDAADGLKFMAMAGWDTQQMMDGLPGVLNLAAASGEDLGKVSDIVTDAMTAFGMEAKRAGEFADTLAAAASSSNTNVGLLGESFKYVAPVAGALGYEAKDTATALGLMANAGIKGSQSGSALRTILTNLAKPTAQMKKAMDEYGISLTNTDGTMKSLDEVMLNLRSSLGGLTEAEQAAAAATIFGKEAMSGALAIVNTSEADYNKLSESINNSTGAAARMSKEMQDNLQGRLTELKSAIEGAALQLYQAMLPALEKLVAVIQKTVNWFSNLNPGIQTAIVAVVGMVAAIGPLLLIFGPLLSAIGGLLTGLGAMSAAMATGATVLAGLTAGFPVLGAAVTLAMGPIGIAVGAIASIVVAGNALCRHFKQDAIPAVRQFGD
ncbi:MAG: phage tail tape measure protein, partial [Candidatus Wallacebacter cryptica]